MNHPRPFDRFEWITIGVIVAGILIARLFG